MVAPFIQLHALAALLEGVENLSGMRVVTRWNAGDLVSGVSDPSVYPWLTARGVSLYHHPRLHLKLYVFNNGSALHTSANVTNRGLGTAPESNIEAGCAVTLAGGDWRQVYAVLGQSVRIDEETHRAALGYIESNRPPPAQLAPFSIVRETVRSFSTLSLPASPNPEELYNFYRDHEAPAGRDADVAECNHDLALYDMPLGLGKAEFLSFLGERFKAHPFVSALVALIRSEKSVCFGRVTEWIQSNCSDRPTPYRWEIKKNTRIMYDWLAQFYQEISWDRPRHSMIIRWEDDRLPAARNGT